MQITARLFTRVHRPKKDILNFFLNISGIQVHDTCGSVPIAQKHLFNLITSTREAGSKFDLPNLGPPLLGEPTILLFNCFS